MTTYAIQTDERAVGLRRGPWRPTQTRRIVDFADGTTPRQACDTAAAELGLPGRDPATADHDVRVGVYRSLSARTPDWEEIFVGFRYVGTVRRAGTEPDVPAWRTAVPGVAGTAGRYGGAVLGRVRTGVRRTGRVRTERAAYRYGERPVPAGGPAPAVWLRTGTAPGRHVTRIFDGVTYYDRTAADRWVPAGRTGPGFAWPEIPAEVRVDATRPLTTTTAGRLTTRPRRPR